jgi:hypothetical protein
VAQDPRITRFQCKIYSHAALLESSMKFSFVGARPHIVGDPSLSLFAASATPNGKGFTHHCAGPLYRHAFSEPRLSISVYFYMITFPYLFWADLQTRATTAGSSGGNVDPTGCGPPPRFLHHS